VGHVAIGRPLMKILSQLLLMGLAPLAVLLLASVGVPYLVVLMLVVVPAFIWTLSVVDDYMGHR
jgi:hypothetical protein